ncbi:glycosyltransferase family 4 protein [Streptomyces montanisoli]|uniref:Glycosyltransferase family 4 protein n=1 Tax=Streptomyces montanisoli TaxID=2798581 RepID=A0A940MCM8_9ACTN|nr:glycosyltransferase family 4 protein [Streptomyces montanisoli]MBP0458458.1 glycosyltransferase family 4 protein [Streptomyces montanisoli]
MSRHVVYLAFGTWRIRAARSHVERLVRGGDRVTLVTGDEVHWDPVVEEFGGWAQVDVVQVHPGRDRSFLQSARKVLTAGTGPLAAADVLVAGDAQALPLAWVLRHKYPDVEFVLEPDSGPTDPLPSSDLAVLTPWYPSPNNPFAGAFVQAMTAAVAEGTGSISVLHTEDWSGRAAPKLNDAIKIATSRMQRHPDLFPTRETPEGLLLRTPVPLVHRKDYAPWVAAQAAAMRHALPGGVIDAPVVHAHTGIYGGALALRLARPDARIVVTEHASFLGKVFAQPAALKIYGEVLERADAFLCVSDHLKQQIAARFPEHAGKLRVVPNVIDFSRFTPGPVRSPELRRWLYLGRLLAGKGVEPLLEAFALVAENDPEVTLTMVGSGTLERKLRERGEELGLGDRFRILPPVSPDEVNDLMHGYDLLVHASRVETFGMTILEAVAAGLPVLAARSRGPQETLAGIEDQVGALFEISDDPQVIVDGYLRLRERSSAFDLTAARTVLESRYGPGAVGRQLLDVYAGREPAPLPAVPQAASDERPAEEPVPRQSAASRPAVPPGEPRGRAVLLALSPTKPRRVVDFAAHLLDRGVDVCLVTARQSVWKSSGLDARVPVVSVEAAEKRLAVPRGERFLVYRVPRSVLGRVRRVAGGRSLGSELAVASLQRAHKKGADAFHKKVFNRGYRQFRPHLLARVTRRAALPELRLDLTDHVFVCDIESTVTGWTWAKAHPQLTVTTHLDRTLYS